MFDENFVFYFKKISENYNDYKNCIEKNLKENNKYFRCNIDDSYNLSAYHKMRIINDSEKKFKIIKEYNKKISKDFSFVIYEKQ